MMDVGNGVAIQTQSTYKNETRAQYTCIGGKRQQYLCMIRIHWHLFRRIVAFFIKFTLALKAQVSFSSHFLLNVCLTVYSYTFYNFRLFSKTT